MSPKRPPQAHARGPAAVTAARARTPEAERKRRLRNERAKRLYARQHRHGNGEIAPNVELDNYVVEMAIDTGWVAANESEDRKQIALGVSKMLKEAGRSHHRQKQKDLTRTDTRCPH